jgi:hypothetical protein
MATETTISRPAPFVEDIGERLAEQTLALQNVPVVTTGIGGITRQAGETDKGFKARQDAAKAFTTRQQSLAGLAPQVAGQDALQQQAQQRAIAGLGSFQPFFTKSTTRNRISFWIRDFVSWTIRTSRSHSRWCTFRSTSFSTRRVSIYVPISITSD